MKPRPPTMREKRRYILVRLEPPGQEIEQRDLYHAVAESLTSLYGDRGAAEAHISVLSIEKGHAVIRCARNTESMIFSAIAAVCRIKDERIALRACLTSGTLRSLREYLKGSEITTIIREEMQIGDRIFPAIRYQRRKIDLIEKGFKNQKPLFLTQEDLEE